MAKKLAGGALKESIACKSQSKGIHVGFETHKRHY